MIVKALEYEGFVEHPDWVYRWNEYEWGAKGTSSFYRPGKIVSPSRLIMDHILDRLGIEPDLRDAWCESHAEDFIEQEFFGEWPSSTPEKFRTRRVFRGTVAAMWDHGLYRTFREQVGTSRMEEAMTWADQVIHVVYVVLLDPEVKTNSHFQKQNPDWDGKKDCYYVGYTGKTPQERFEDHKAGHNKGRGIVRDYGVRLVPAWYEMYGAMNQADAKKKEEELAHRLRRQGYGVYQN